MKKISFIIVIIILLVIPSLVHASCETGTDTSITQYGITWAFDGSYDCGTFVNGDYWVVGPVVITGISNTFHGYPGDGYDGSMINPPTDGTQGYVETVSGYDGFANVMLSIPFTLDVNESLVSSVTFVDTDPEGEKPSGGNAADVGLSNLRYRPALRDAAVLTSLDGIPIDSGATVFRPPYVGTDKPLYSVNDIQNHLLPSLAPVASTPSLSTIEDWFQRPWIDHLHDWPSRFIHPSNNMMGLPYSGYGYDMAGHLGIGAMMLLLDENIIGDKTGLLTNYVQIGIDFYGILDNGGSWPSNGGHQMGRKWPILFAGLLLNHSEMLSIGNLTINHPITGKSYFQEDGDTFFVTQADVDQDHSSCDTRTTGACYDYTSNEIGEPRWGIRHSYAPEQDNNHCQAEYISLNGPAYVGPMVAALVLDQRDEWGYNAFFDWTDRWASVCGPLYWSTVYYRGGGAYEFTRDMWIAYRDDYGCIWTANDPSDMYSLGYYNCSDVIVDCDSIGICNDYPNRVAVDYDPCDIGCAGLPDSCGDSICDSGETCEADSCCDGMTYDPGTQVCCAGSVQTGDCCTESDCSPTQDCINYQCTDTCTSQGYLCCSSCLSGAQSSFDDSCSGDVCCEYCNLGCLISNTSFSNHLIPQQTGSFNLTYNATPLNADMDGLVTLSESRGSFFSDYAVLVRFNTVNQIDARDGSSYRSDNTITYSPFNHYDFRIEVDVPANVYSVYVTPQGQSEQLVAFNYSFRTEQLGITELNYISVWADNGIHEVCDISFCQQTFHRSDTNQDGCIETEEMIAYMERWKVSSQDVSMIELMESIGLWKAGTGCS